jgi:hypothetical protein
MMIGSRLGTGSPITRPYSDRLDRVISGIGSSGSSWGGCPFEDSRGCIICRDEARSLISEDLMTPTRRMFFFERWTGT